MKKRKATSPLRLSHVRGFWKSLLRRVVPQRESENTEPSPTQGGRQHGFDYSPPSPPQTQLKPPPPQQTQAVLQRDTESTPRRSNRYHSSPQMRKRSSSQIPRDSRIDDMLSILEERIRSRSEPLDRAKSVKLLLERTSRSAEEEFVAQTMISNYSMIQQNSSRAQICKMMEDLYSLYTVNQPPPPPPAQLMQIPFVFVTISDIFSDFRNKLDFYFSQSKESKSTSESRTVPKSTSDSRTVSKSTSDSRTLSMNKDETESRGIQMGQIEIDQNPDMLLTANGSKTNELQQQAEETRTINGWKFGTLPGSEADHLELVNNIAGNDDLVKRIVSSWNEMMKTNIRKGETYNERLESLKKGKIKKGKAKTGKAKTGKAKTGAKDDEENIKEKEHTHPFIFGILRTFFRTYSEQKIYSTHHADLIRNDATPSEKQYLLNSSLYLYTEKQDDVANVSQKESLNEVTTYSGFGRRPDAAFFQRGTPVDNSDIVKYDLAAREHGLLVGVEAKKNLGNANMNDALLECQRDYAHLTDKFAFKKNRAGFSIITDGVSWYFLCINWQMILTRDRKYQWKHFIRQSKKMNFETDEEKTELAEWLLFALNLSLTQPNLSADVDGEFSTTVLGRNSLTGIFRNGTRSSVSLWQNNEGEPYVLKLFNIGPKEREQKYIKYLKLEMEYLQKLESNENTASMVTTMFDGEYGFWLEYGGTPLEKMDICGKRGQQLAVIVKRDIWYGALAALTAQNICHGDIHQLNILVCLKRNKATLIDFESAKDFGRDLSDSPIRHRLDYDVANEEVDKIAVATTLEYLWDPLKTHFDSHLKERLLELKEKIDREKLELWNKRGPTPKGIHKEVEKEIRVASFKAVFDPVLDKILTSPGHDSAIDGNASLE